MENNFPPIVFYNKLLKKFLSLGYLPRWVIFLIDNVIVLSSSLFTFFIVNGLTVKFYDHLNVGMRLVIILVLNAFFFLLFKTYLGIIRHSTFLDGVKLLASTSSAYLSLIFLNYLYFFYSNQKVYLTTSLFIGYVITFLLLFLLNYN